MSLYCAVQNVGSTNIQWSSRSSRYLVPNNLAGGFGRSVAVVTGRGGRTVVGRFKEARKSAKSPRMRITVLATEVGRLASRFGTGPGSRRSEEKLLGVIKREEKLLTCLGGMSVRECHTLVRGLNLEGWWSFPGGGVG